ncbi:MAG: formylglycine-generating enzyme family protein, partial [Thermoanaerobaculia bacterium]
RHRVRILQPFLMAAVPVTVAQYAAFDSGRGGKGSANLPVTNVEWNRALAFCEWLGGKFSWARGARLPTEEEWEYACRAGTETRYWSGDDEADLERVGWYSDNSGSRLHAVGEKPANPWGLYDVHGNVWEWTLSLWKSDYAKQKNGLEIDPAAEPADLAGGATAGGAGARRVVRGGSCWFSADWARSAYRYHWDPWDGHAFQGFRVLLPVPSGPELP